MAAALEAAYIVALALAFAAIAARLLIETFVENPLRNAASAASNVPGIGGALAWLLTQAANEVGYMLAVLSWIGQKGTDDGVTNMNNLTLGLMNWFLGDVIFWARWVGNESNNLSNIIADWGNLWWQVWFGTPSYIASVATQLGNLQGLVVGSILPEIRGIEAGVRDLSNLVNLRVIDDIARLTSDLLNLRWWIDNVLTPGFERALQGVNDRVGAIERDLPTRALEAEAEAIRARLAQLEHQVAILSALGILAIAGADVIENIRCLGGVKCDLLSPLLSGDLEDRVTELELSGS